MAPNKKAVVEVQFNWIFILIAGALILFLFSSIILKQKSTADSTAQTTLLKDITSIAVGSETTAGVTNELELSKASISFGCNTIRIGQKSQPLQQMAIFSPSTAQTPLIIHTREWSLPFRVTNVVYLSSPKIRYVLIGDSTLAKQINKSMPEKFLEDYYEKTTDYTSFLSTPPQKDNHIRIILFKGGSYTDTTTLKNQLFSKYALLTNKETSLLIVDGSQNTGDIEFYSKGKTSWDKQDTVPPTTFHYLKEEMLVGAIFTDTYEQYQCIQSNMLKKLRTVSDIYDKRRHSLFTNTTAPHMLVRCNSDYKDSTAGGQAAISLNTLKTSSNLDNLFAAAYGPTIGLATINKDLERSSCPLLY